MKLFSYTIYIYAIFTCSALSQNITLKIEGKDSISKIYTQNNTNKKNFINIKNQNKEIQQIETNLLNKGYFNAEIHRNKINDTSYLLNIKINQHFKRITILHQKKLNKQTLEEILTQNTTQKENSFNCSTTELETNLNNIINQLSNSGKTFSSLQLKNIRINEKKVTAELHITETKENRIKNVVIRGYDKFPKKYIKHYLKIKGNQILNTEEVEEKSKQINNLKFAKEIKKPEILFSKDSITVYLYVEKQKSNTFDGYIGFNSNDETQKLEFNGNLNLKLINNLNTGEELHIKYLSTANEQKKINISTKVPYLFNSAFSIQANLDILKRDSTFSNSSQTIQLKYPIYRNINIGSGMRFTKSNALKNLSITNMNFSKQEYLLNITHQTNQNHPIFKIKNETTIEVATSNRITETEKTPQQSIYLNTEHIFNLNEKNSIFLRNESYYLITENVLENELYNIGGINSIRGFKENSIPTHYYSFINTEYRILLNKRLYTHTVMDYGVTKNNNTKKLDNLIGFGIGFGLQNKSNLLKFIFSNSKINSEKIKFSNSQIHLSIKTSF